MVYLPSLKLTARSYKLMVGSFWKTSLSFEVKAHFQGHDAFIPKTRKRKGPIDYQ